MRSAQLEPGRVFVLRLEDGEILHEVVESFCESNGIAYATVTATGGVDASSYFTVGPRAPVGDTIEPLTHTLSEPCELTGTGTVFPDADGNPIMHMHGSVGRDGKSVTGCFRRRMVAWVVLEVVIQELVGSGPVREVSDPRIESKLLEIR